MDTLTIIMGAAMTAFIFINFFVKSWWLSLSALLLGIGCVAQIINNPPINVYLLLGVAVAAVGQLLALIIAKHNDS